MSLTNGTRLGPYEIVGALGAGGMGEVYRARDTTLNREVAIKVLLPAVADDLDREPDWTALPAATPPAVRGSAHRHSVLREGD